MRLEKIILHGFKSFADKTEFNFDRNITAIVGPNGCGKSNVVDAVKWVLGEQSTKSLRSSQMLDVIFSGSGSRKPMSMAEVSMFFSGVPGVTDEENLVQITRRLYRNGDSAYLINNKSCRLKDIRELFMDTGVGMKAYSIIEQGQIAQLISSSKSDRREIFEEAAGISKFKAHKKEASRKLERTEQNLLRLADIVSEVQKQLRSVKMQAGKARNYIEYADKLKELRVSYSLSEFHKLSQKQINKNSRLDTIKDSFSQAVAEVAKNDTLQSRLRSEITELETEINRNDNFLISTKSKIEQQLERVDYLQKRIEELKERKQTSGERIHRLEEQISRLSGNLAGCEFRMQENNELAEEKQKELSELQDYSHEINMECATIEADLEDEKSGILDTVRRTAQLHNELKSSESFRENLSNQKDRLSGRVNETQSQLESLLTNKTQHDARKNDISKVIEELEKSLDIKREQMENNNHQLTELSDMMASSKQARSSIQGELRVLADMENNREGLNKSVKDILRERTGANAHKYEYIDGIVADVLRADVSYAPAVEAVLNGKAEYIVVNSTTKLLEDSHRLKEFGGRINFVCIDKMSPRTDKVNLSNYSGVVGNLVDFVHCDDIYSDMAFTLLGKSIVVESLNTAMAIAPELGDDYTFVTREGEMLREGHIISIGKISKNAGLISRKSRLHELQNELDQANNEINALQEQLDSSNQQNDHLGDLCKDLRTSIYEANTEKIDINSKLGMIEQNIERLRKEEPILVKEIEVLHTQIEESVKKDYDSRQKLEELDTVNNQRTDRIEELEMQYDEKKAVQEEMNSQLTELRIAIGQTTVKRNAIQQEISSLKSQLHHARITIESARTEMLGSDEQVEQTERTILNTESSICDLYVEKDDAQKLRNHLHDEAGDLLKQLSETEDSLRLSRNKQSELEQQMHSIDLELNEIRVKLEDLTQRVGEELEMDIEQMYHDYQEEDMDWDAVRREINELKGKIVRLGNVNVNAIEELEELEKRDTFLTEQVEDLDSSKQQLQQLINKINKESREKFQAVFDEIRGNFQEMFRKLFGGGKADVMLEEGVDILEAGIDIIAQPPGKGAKNITLLSGGEKTMTAMALQFSIFKSKPSPFCFLDEVDAALDEANNERFNYIVKEFEKISQFVIISHSKRTMSIADVLFGVTMQQQGVSKKISVKFEEVDSDQSSAVA